jgi:hypothetical protein
MRASWGVAGEVLMRGLVIVVMTVTIAALGELST